MVTIYKKNNGELYLHGYAKTTMGVLLACYPFFSFQTNEVERLQEQVMQLLRQQTEIIPHSTTFNQLDDLYSMAGCRDWKAFTLKASCFHVQQQDNQIMIIPTEKDGAGFKDLNESNITCDEANLAVHLERLIC